jgi:hypothetical protein
MRKKSSVTRTMQGTKLLAQVDWQGVVVIDNVIFLMLIFNIKLIVRNIYI